MLEGFFCVVAAALAFIIAFRLLTRRPGAFEGGFPLPLCPNCGYDLRESPEVCPECGKPVPDELRLRADLMAGRFPEWLTHADRSLPQRVPDPDEPWRRFAVADLRQVRPLEAMLDRAGIAHRSELQLLPGPTDFLGIPRDTAPMAAVIEAPEADWPIVSELALYVNRALAAGKLEAMERELGIEPEATISGGPESADADPVDH